MPASASRAGKALGMLIVCGAAAMADEVRAACITGHSGETTVQEILNGLSAGSAPNATTGCVTEESDAAWRTVTGYSEARLHFEYAGYATINTFGIYDLADPAKQFEIFSGADTTNTSKTLEVSAIGATGTYSFSLLVNRLPVTSTTFSSGAFGFYLKNTYSTFYSDSQLNENATDHLAAFHLLNNKWGWSDAYLLAWEDLPDGGDKDFNDMGVVVSGIAPVPLPAAAWLMISGLAGVAAVARRRRPASPA